MQMYMRFVSVLKGRGEGEVVEGSSLIVSARLRGAVGCAFGGAECGVAFSESNMPPVGVDL